MAETNAPSAEVLEQIALQISRRLVVSDGDKLVFSFTSLNERGSPSTSTLDMGETFELWRLTPAAVDKFSQEGGDLRSLATRTGRWHHQIKLDGGVAAFARSGNQKGGWIVDEIYVTPLAETLDQAIERADALFSQDAIAVLLTAPAYQVEALWFLPRGDTTVNDSELLVVTARTDLTLTPFQRVTSVEFIKALQGVPIGMGIKSKITAR